MPDPATRSAGRWALRAASLAAASVLAIALLVGFATGALPAGIQGAARAAGLVAPRGAPTVAPTLFDEAAPGPSAAATPDPVLPAVTPAGPPDADRVRERLAAAGRTGGQTGAVVIDAGSGEQVYAADGDRPMIPASTLKLLTTAAVLGALGPEHRFATSVVLGDGAEPAADATPAATPAPPRRIVLVGGGDPYLAGGDPRTDRGSIGELAGETAEALKAAGATKVDLDFDTSLFAGPAWNETWPDGYRDQVTPISALWLDGGVRSDGTRPGDPAKEAADAFAKALRGSGIEVGKVAAGAAPDGAEAIARVESMPLALIVERVISTSDNNAAEILLRQVSVAGGGDGSFADGEAAAARVLRPLGAWSDAVRMRDGSGLSRENRLPTEVLTRALGLGVSGDPKFRSLLTGMSVAGAEGTLRQRFVEDGTSAGRGEVRAKTGTLRQVHTLAGYVVARDGTLLVFAFMVNNDAVQNDYANRTWLEKMSAALAGCGCR
ncbi:D-alanyl-D-alanine carboxypeptidase/D-alanyl-D-alanine-endopeptidase (penicillin-binding protein 4) [Naumannella cuiyingiana]|uniref:D-alanyl-D-alanine carboxypeptidase/D-alanyl-D-alanine-endopeptidase (Penicillin-binding protein 4) n=1 Tax=Naumannella cuiyingiana TaxID=1347891 RepID=A0A7Z0D9U4_9ACTN|nr:D-alanyl-D-alanine carboxypeptidase/D-alanyl-D-alanine-endopeptidase (penicillin-binding protein 4) [Naumannella cuiyingiana]